MQLKSRTGERFECYSAGANAAERAVLIIHDWWGIKPYNRQWAQRLAALGYRALVVDLYDGGQPGDAEEASEMMRSLDQACADAKLLAALELLTDQHRRVAVLGWSFGGLQAQYATLLKPQSVAATVFYYCRVISEPQALARLEGPVLGIFSETERTWPEKQERWIAAMDAAGKVYEHHSFNADHGFVNPESPRFDKAATEASWQLTVDFLRRHL
jgi:carboxymethylenebutenolidase